MSRSCEEVITTPNEVAKGNEVSTSEQDAQRMDVDLPLMEEAEEIDSGNNHILETQDNRLSLSHIDDTGMVEEEV